MQTERGSYDYVESGGKRMRLDVGFLSPGGGLVVEVKQSCPQQPFPCRFQPELPLDEMEHPQMVA